LNISTAAAVLFVPVTVLQTHTHCFDCILQMTNLCLFLQLPWTGSNVEQQFHFDECKETRSWEDIAKEGPGKFTSGGISNLSPDLKATWQVWGCWQGHPCLSKLSGVKDGEHMCYVYNEEQKAWYPWGTKSDIDQQSACHG
jgi:hypothetical protein